MCLLYITSRSLKMSDTLLLIDCTGPSFFTCYGYLSFMTEMNIINVMGIKTKLRNVPIYQIVFLRYILCSYCLSILSILYLIVISYNSFCATVQTTGVCNCFEINHRIPFIIWWFLMATRNLFMTCASFMTSSLNNEIKLLKSF